MNLDDPEYKKLASIFEIKLLFHKPIASAVFEGILTQIKDIYKDNFQNEFPNVVQKLFYRIIDMFAGRMKWFNKCGTGYHDLQHTLQSTMVIVRVMDGWNKSGNSPAISRQFFELGT
ncbi:unnamed protein product, partial [marine sediment metagenome]